MLIDMLTATGSFFLLICAILCIAGLNQDRGRRKLQAYKQMLFARVMYF